MRPLSGATRPLLRHPLLMALETEYSVTFMGADGDALPREAWTGRAVRSIAPRVPHLCGRDTFDLFLANGGRFYRDSGLGLCNLEYATPECSSPDELVAHVRAGDKIAEEAVVGLAAAATDVDHAVLSKTNFDYQGTTNASHENYLYARSPQHMARHLIPLLASRVVVCGGGGFDDASPGIVFMHSPRVAHLEHAMSYGAQDSRAIFTLKGEDLSGARYRRLQLLCSEGVRCESSERLRVGMVALTMRLVEAGALPGRGMTLVDPLAAINTFSRDLGMIAQAPLTSGRSITALEIQRHYLKAVERRLGEPWMPPWAESLCAEWHAILDALADQPSRLVGILDSPTKRQLFHTHCTQAGVDRAALPRWGRALRRVLSSAAMPPAHARRRTPDLWPLLDTRGPQRARLASTLADFDLDANDLERFITLRDALFELDVRFGELGPASLFAALERDHVIAPTTISAERIAQAKTIPPSDFRGVKRAAWIRHLHDGSDPMRYACHWDYIQHFDSNRREDLSDPFDRTLPPKLAPAAEHGGRATPAVGPAQAASSAAARRSAP